MNVILDPLRGDFGLIDAAELILVGAGCGAVGFWIVQFGRAFLAESLTHALLPGLVVASLLGASLVAGALAGVLVAYVAALAVARAPRTSPAAATSITVTLLVALGALIASTGGRGSAVFENLLFGDPVAVSNADVAIGALLLLALATALWLLHERFAALAFDPAAAASLGVSPDRVRAALLLVVVSAVAIAVNVSGSLPALALLTGPAVAGSTFARWTGRAVLWSAAIGAGCGIGGLYLSYYADWPAGASVAIACSAAAAAAAAAPIATRVATWRSGRAASA